MTQTKVTSDLITSLDASKLTGSLPASMATDLAAVRSDILKLALHQAIDGNRVAYNLEDSFIDGFEDDTGITLETTVDRNGTGEYINAIAYTNSDWPYSADGDQQIYDGGGNMFDVPDGTDWQRIDVHTDRLGYWNNPSSYAEWFYIDYLTAYTWSGIKATIYNSHAMVKTWRLEYSNDGSNWTYADLTGSTTSALSGFSLDNDDNFSITDASGGEITNVTNTGNDSYHGGIITFGTAFSARYLRVSIGTKIDNGNAYPGWASFIPIKQTQAINATGTLISDPQTASTSRTSASGVIIYEDQAGTSTLGTDLKIYFSCNNSAWTEAASYGTATTYSGSKKLVKLGATTCTAGTSIAMKAVWANQSGSKEARLHGWAFNY